MKNLNYDLTMATNSLNMIVDDCLTVKVINFKTLNEQNVKINGNNSRYRWIFNHR
jgi:hypothetical protein